MSRTTVKTVALKKLAEYSNSKVSASTLNADNFIGVDNLLQNKLGKTFAEYVPTKGTVTRYNKGDTLIGNIRPYLKKIWYATNSGGSSADVLTIRAKTGVDSRFIYYCLFQDHFFDYVMAAPKGTQMPRGDKTRILDYPIPNFGKEDQQRIASIFSAIDDKIELNNKINAELEQMAKTLYDYWFMQFDFPDENGNPYKSSGGAMVFNEELKREIPIDWEVKNLSQIANITMGQSPPGSSYNDSGNGSVFFQGSTEFGSRHPVVKQYTTLPSRFAKKGDILLSVRAPVGTMNIADRDCCIGRGLAALSSKIGSQAYLFEVMQYFKQIFDRKNSDGTTFGSITKDGLHSLKVVYPGDSLISDFEKIIEPAYLTLNKNGEENQKLAELRDWLLPMLMNGQVTIKKLK